MFPFVRDYSISEHLSDLEHINLTAIADEYFRSISQESDKPKGGCHGRVRDCVIANAVLNSNIAPIDKFESYKDDFVYKYVKTHDYENYIKHGTFRLGTLSQYQDAEGEPFGDGTEGVCTAVTAIGMHDVRVTIAAGYRYLIFSSTRTTNHSDIMHDRFGDLLLRIAIKPFSEAVARIIAADAVSVKRVKYSDVKVVRCQPYPVFMQSSTIRIDQKLVDYLEVKCAIGNVFTKPVSFEDEDEVRCMFSMPENQLGPINVTDRGLLQFVDVLPVSGLHKS
jgi:hypothetical protein